MLQNISVSFVRSLAVLSLIVEICFSCLSCTSVRSNPETSVPVQQAMIDSNEDNSTYPELKIRNVVPVMDNATIEPVNIAVKDKSDNKTVLQSSLPDIVSAPLHHFTLTGGTAESTAGQSWALPANDVVVTAYDRLGNIKADYTGRVYFLSTDGAATLPFTAVSKYTFSLADRGSHTFAGTGFILKTTGRQTITVTDGTISKTSAEIIVYCDGSKWSEAAGPADFTPRKNHSCVTFDKKIWVIGGVAGYKRNDVWYSPDGDKWVCSTEHAGFTPRSDHLTLVYDNKIWMIGGDDGNYFMGTNDVWYSEDGSAWIVATENAAFSRRYFHDGVVYDNRMWVIGGKFQDDVWWSKNGSDWFQADSNPAFGSRYGHSCVVYDNRMWVIGGYSAGYKNDVWWSTDGSKWHQATANAGFSPRYGHESLVYGNKIWVIGGHDGNPEGDVWYSKNGSDWTAATEMADFGTRNGHACTVFNNRMWLIDGNFSGDVWYSY